MKSFDLFTVSHDGPYCAISYDSPTFHDLSFYMNLIDKKIDRIDPDTFLKIDHKQSIRFINLVTRFPLRQKISQHINDLKADRFSFFGCTITNASNIQSGCFFYPDVTIYPSARIGHDVIIHSQSSICHNTNISQGSYLSPNVILCGSVNLGENCWMGAGSLVVDKISIAAGTYCFARSVVADHITIENTIYKKHRK